MKNLLMQLQYKGEENYWTEAFAYLLEHLIQFDHKVAQELLIKISANRFDISHHDPSVIKVFTQNQTKNGITDIEINSPDFAIVIENKVEAGLGYLQLEKYIEHLKNCGKNYLLVLLSKYPINPNFIDHIIVVRWHEIYKFLEKIDQDSLSLISCFLIREFIEFLRQKGQSTEIVSSGLSQSIDFIRQQNELVYHKQIKSLNSIQDIEELNSLSNFFLTAQKAIKAVRPKTKVKIGSGKNDDNLHCPWIALNLDNADIFCVIYFNHPNLFAFETYKRKFDVEKMQQINRGEIFTSRGRWKNYLDLEEVGFYETPLQQREIIEKFIKQCYIDLGENLP